MFLVKAPKKIAIIEEYIKGKSYVWGFFGNVNF